MVRVDGGTAELSVLCVRCEQPFDTRTPHWECIGCNRLACTGCVSDGETCTRPPDRGGDGAATDGNAHTTSGGSPSASTAPAPSSNATAQPSTSSTSSTSSTDSTSDAQQGGSTSENAPAPSASQHTGKRKADRDVSASPPDRKRSATAADKGTPADDADVPKTVAEWDRPVRPQSLAPRRRSSSPRRRALQCVALQGPPPKTEIGAEGCTITFNSRMYTAAGMRRAKQRRTASQRAASSPRRAAPRDEWRRHPVRARVVEPARSRSPLDYVEYRVEF